MLAKSIGKVITMPIPKQRKPANTKTQPKKVMIRAVKGASIILL